MISFLGKGENLCEEENRRRGERKKKGRRKEGKRKVRKKERKRKRKKPGRTKEGKKKKGRKNLLDSISFRNPHEKAKKTFSPPFNNVT